MSTPALKPCVRVRGVSKKFSRSLKRSFVFGATDVARAVIGLKEPQHLRPSEFWALRDISLELHPGQSIGIVGRNGSGKTTLLRIISGIINATRGSVEVHGRIAPMIALGAGFKPVLSGRENVFLNLSILGVPPREIARRFDSILDFSELQDSIDAPVGTYSSGMISRLGFACAIHTDPSILIVDEVLSVGDARFRVKCRNKINELRRGGTSMLLVSHSPILIEALCDECIYMREGTIVDRGNPGRVLRRYEDDEIRQSTSHDKAALESQVSSSVSLEGASPNSGLSLTSVRFLNNGSDRGFVCCGEEATIVCTISSLSQMSGLSINLMIFDLDQPGGQAVQYITSRQDVGNLHVEAGVSEVSFNMPHLGLPAGMYRVKISISQGKLHDILDVADGLRLIVRDNGRALHCSFYQPRQWILNGTPQDPLKDAEEQEVLDVVGDS